MKKLLYFLGFILITSSCKKTETQPPSPGRMVKDFSLETGQVGQATIFTEGDVYKVIVRVSPKADLTKIIPNIKISDNSTISPSSGQSIDITSTKNFTYTVTAASGQVRKWEVEFRIFDASITDYGTYSIASAATNGVMQVKGDLLFNEKFSQNALINIAVAEPTTADNIKRWQEWDIIYKSTISNVKYYQIRNLHSGLFLNAASTDITSGLQVKQTRELKAANDQQLWKIEESTEAGKYIISNKATGLYLEKTGDNTSNFKVVQASIKTAAEQKWIVTKLNRDSHRDDEVVNFFNRNISSQGSVAFDQGNSIPLAWGANKGKVLWVTQDAWDGSSLKANNMFQCGNFFSYGNSIMIQQSATDWNSANTPNITIPGGANNRARQICTIQPNNSFAWPSAGVEIDDKVYMHCGEGQGLGATNQSLYVLTESEGLQWSAQRTTPANMTGQTNIMYSSGMVKASDGYVYVFGASSPPNSFGYSLDMHVARFQQSNPQVWTFWNGSSWANSPVPGTTSRIGTGLGSSFISYLNGKYILMTMDQGFNCGDNKRGVYLSTSSSPTGPFTERKRVYTIDEYFYGQNARYYTAIIHPSFDNGKNELLITYSLNYSACGVSECQGGVLDPYFYRVKGVRVPYEMFGL